MNVENVFYHPNWKYKDEFGCQCKSPSMVALVHNLEGELVGLHTTILMHSGAKRLDSEGKKITRFRTANPGALSGSAIRLNQAGPVLGVGEGIETSLALGLLCGIPVWACGDAGKMAVVRLPDVAEKVFIAIDNDDTGKRAASELSNRLLAERRTVVLVHSEKLGLPHKGDLADFLKIAQAG